MKYFLTAFLGLVVTNLFAQSLTKHVLFIGNSYIYTNDMPQLVSSMAASTGDQLVYDQHTVGGYTLLDHYNDTISTNKIQAGGWDYVVLQDQSQLPAFDNYDDFGGVYLSAMAQLYSPCSRTLFYMTWGRENGDQGNCAEYPNLCTYEGMDSMLRLRYTQMAQAAEQEVTPVGAVWRYIKQNYPSIDLYQPDESHPTLTGSYLVACCFYTSIFKKDPTFITYSSTVDAAQASIIRQATKAILFDSLSNWDFTVKYPTTDFSFVVGAGTNELDFTNLSQNADSYLWDFGDGATSTEKNPAHNYINNGNYIITLTAYNCDQSGTYTTNHQASATFCLHTPTISPDDLILCPNTSDTIWTQPADAYQWYDDNGDAIPNATNQFLVPEGLHFYSVITTENNCSELSQPVFVSSATSAVFYVEGVGNSGIFGQGCIGDTVYLSVATLWLAAPDLSPFVNWYEDSVLIPLPPNDSLMITESGMYGVTVEHPSCPDYIAANYQNINFVFIDCETGISDDALSAPIAMFPNPTTDYVTIRNNETTNVNYSIVDATGRTMTNASLTHGDNMILVNGFASGVYFVKFEQSGVKPLKLTKL